MNCKGLENVFHVVGNFVLGILYICECIYLVYVCLQFTLTLESVMLLCFVYFLTPPKYEWYFSAGSVLGCCKTLGNSF